MRTEAERLFFNGTVIPAFPLTLHEDRSFDPRRQRALIRYYLDAGVGGLAVAVHTTQFEIRDPKYALFEPILKLASEEADAFERRSGRTIIRIAGACGPESQAVKEAETAAKYGYDAVLLSPGGMNALSIDELIHRTEAVGEVMPVIGFYLQNAVGGRVLPYDYWRRLCELRCVKGIKAAPFNRYKTLDVVRAAAFSSRADEIALYTGNDDNIVTDLLTTWRFKDGTESVEKRFNGGLLGHWSLWTKTVCDLFPKLKSASENKMIPTELLTLAQEITDCNAAFFDAANDYKGLLSGVHEVLRRQGLMEGIWALNPDEALSSGQAEEISRVWRMYPHLNDDAFVHDNLAKWLAD